MRTVLRRKKIKIVLILIICLPLAGVAGFLALVTLRPTSYISATQTAAKKSSASSPSALLPKEPEVSDINIPELHNLVNAERTKVGLMPLTYSNNLAITAQLKCSDMVTRNYWSHDTPDGAKTWVFIKPYIPNYHKLGENLASNYHSSQITIMAWMISAEHRRNILDPEFQYEGLAVCKSEKFINTGVATLLIVEHFVGY